MCPQFLELEGAAQPHARVEQGGEVFVRAAPGERFDGRLDLGREASWEAGAADAVVAAALVGGRTGEHLEEQRPAGVSVQQAEPAEGLGAQEGGGRVHGQLLERRQPFALALLDQARGGGDADLGMGLVGQGEEPVDPRRARLPEREQTFDGEASNPRVRISQRAQEQRAVFGRGRVERGMLDDGASERFVAGISLRDTRPTDGGGAVMVRQVFEQVAPNLRGHIGVTQEWVQHSAPGHVPLKQQFMGPGECRGGSTRS